LSGRNPILTSDREPVPQLQLIWPESLLDAVPRFRARPAAGYRLRTYRPGDEPRFFELMDLAGWPGWNDEKLRPWLFRSLPEGWFMAVHEQSDRIVGTAMATHDHTWTRPFCGELAWLAADPAHRGWGLGLAVSAAVTARFIEAGYRCIHLFTEHWRLAAIKIYLKLGYVPYLYSKEQPELWQEICQKLGWPYTPESWQS
jgi:mycothiol synthase